MVADAIHSLSDPLASIVVGCFIVRVAWMLLRKNFRDLMEASLPEETEALREHLGEDTHITIHVEPVKPFPKNPYWLWKLLTLK